MRKLLILLAVLTLTVSVASAQQTQQKKSKELTTYEKGRNSIGLRIGNDIELSYQKYLRDANRVEVGVGYNFTYGFTVGATYQWLWAIGDDGFNWYAGCGAQLGAWNDKFGLGVIGVAGIEYNFQIPLTLSIDWRPGVHLLPGDMHFGWEGFALGVRYRF